MKEKSKELAKLLGLWDRKYFAITSGVEINEAMYNICVRSDKYRSDVYNKEVFPDFDNPVNFVKLLECVSFSSHLKGCTAYSLNLHPGFRDYFILDIISKLQSFTAYLKDKKREDVKPCHICEWIECNNLLEQAQKTAWVC